MDEHITLYPPKILIFFFREYIFLKHMVNTQVSYINIYFTLFIKIRLQIQTFGRCFFNSITQIIKCKTAPNKMNFR